MAYIKAKKEDTTSIYGAKWLGTSDPSWIRTDATSLFSNPNPYYSGMSGSPSSPFDDILPWKGIKIVEDSSAGTLVEIPKFYYKWSRPTGYSDGLALQISMKKHDGFYCSPAHADRGDGKGERDKVYIGRYLCANDYKSKTGVTPYYRDSLTQTNNVINIFRTNIHNIGNTIWQQDYMMYWTIRMLYLVEFANWKNVNTIGNLTYIQTSSDVSRLVNTGNTDLMPYHTGTTTDKSTANIGGMQYRYIENICNNLRTYYDGIYASNNRMYAIKNPTYFGNSSYYIDTGITKQTSATNNGFIKNYGISNISGLEYFLWPSEVVSSNTYICAYLDGQGYLNSTQFFNSNLFAINTYYTRGHLVGSRLMKLP